jgi:threonine dehydrogenase-like Zn-dependent dehydrogenase
MLGRGGVLVTVGGHRPEVRASIQPGRLVNLQLEIRGTQLGGNNYEACLAVLSRGKYPFSRLVTHRFPLREIQLALETFERRGTCIKPAIVFDQPS